MQTADQIVPRILNSPRFKKEMDMLIQAAVIKGQIKLLDSIIDQTSVDMALEYDSHVDGMKYVLLKVRYDFYKQLDHIATTEQPQLYSCDEHDWIDKMYVCPQCVIDVKNHTPLTWMERHPLIDDTPEDWDEGKCIHNYVKYQAQGMGANTVYICTACGKTREVT